MRRTHIFEAGEVRAILILFVSTLDARMEALDGQLPFALVVNALSMKQGEI